MFNENFSKAWQARYGQLPEADLPELGTFLAHRSIRNFTSTEIPEDVISGLVAAAQSASTSSNLQLWSVVSVQDPDRREAIAKLCSNQDQIRSSSWFFAFLADHHRIRKVAESVGEAAAGLSYFEFLLMAIVDAALAAERMVVAAEALGIGACYIGALRNHPPQVSELLNLPVGVFGTFGLCFGYPDPTVQAEIKPRLPQSSIWFREKYDQSAGIGDYDTRMSEFYESQKMKGAVTWSMRSGKRLDESSLGGREILKAWLESMDMGLR